MSTSSRPTRSRVSSPFVPASKNTPTEVSNTSAEASAKPKTFMDRWVEPERPAPRPSFAEAGLERHNVVLNMAPLGTLPSQKIRKSVLGKPEGFDGIGRLANARKSGPSSASTPGESVVTPEPPSESQRRRSVSTNKTDEKVEEVPATPPPKTPQQTSSPRKSASRPSVPPPQSSGQGVFALQRSPITSTTPVFRPAPIAAQITTPQMPVMNSNGFREVNFDLCDKVVEVAVQEALDRYRYPTAYALRTLYDDHRANIRIVRLIESIYTESATDEQRTEFNSIMKHKKREGKKGRTGEYYFNGDGSDPAPHRPIFQAIHALNPPPAPYVTPYTQRPSSVTMSDPQASASSVNHQSPASDLKDLDHAHVSKKQKPNDYQPDASEVPEDGNTNGINHEGDHRIDHLNNMEIIEDVVGSVDDLDAAIGTDTVEKHEDVEDIEPALIIHDEPPVAFLDDSSVKATVEEVVAGKSDATLDTEPGTVPHGQSSPENGKEEDEREAQELQQRNSRSRSSSTSSSLSSVSEHAIDGAFASANNSPAVQTSKKQLINPSTGLPIIGSGHGNLFGLPVDQPRFVSPYGSPYTNAQTFSAVAETVVRNQAPQPISKAGPRFHTFAVTPSTSSAAAPPSSSTNTANNSTNASNQTSTNPSMAPVVIPPSSTTSSTTSGPKFPPTFKIKNFKKLQGRQVIDENDQPSLLKRKAREAAQANYKPVESYDRHQVVIPSSQDVDSHSDGPDSIQVAPSKRPVKKQRKIILKTKSRETRHSSARSNNYDSEENNLSSPTTLGFHPHLAPGSTPSSRAATPSVSLRQPTRKAKAGTGLRVKSSPMKKKGGTSAGIPRSGERNHSPVGNGVSSATQDAVENDDFCSACGGNGDLVCCDGRSCPRSFHFKCVDPPLIDDLPDEWFCNECDAPQRPVEDYKGLFGYLFFSLDSKCPRAFSLPAPIRDYFEDVKTGTEGEYEEVQPAKPKNPKGWEEAPDYFRLKDAKGNAIFCHDCGGQAEAPARSIINCTFCNLYWHMDCLPVPLAREPGPGRPWKCPAHVDDVLTKLPDNLGPAHRFRRIKGAGVIRPAFSRGMRNNGYIEIENDPSGDEEEQTFFVQREYGHVYKLPEKGIKLDFISKIKKAGAAFRRDVPTPQPKAVPPIDSWNSRSVDEQQAALNLASMLVDSEMPDETTRLINTLIAEAPPTVIALIARGSSDTIGKSKMTKSDKQSMVAAIEALQARLAAAAGDDEEMAAEPRLEQSAVAKGSSMASSDDVGKVDPEAEDDVDTEMLI